MDIWKQQTVCLFWLLFAYANLQQINDSKIEQVLCHSNHNTTDLSLPLLSNTTYLVQPGNYCVLENIQHLRVYGENRTSPALIKCLQKNNSLESRGFAFVNVSNLVIENVRFEGCGSVVPLRLLNFSGSAFSGLRVTSVIFSSHCINASFQSVAVTNYLGYALIAINLLGASVINSLSVTSNRRVNISSPLCYDSAGECICKGSGVLIEFMDSIVNENTSLVLSNSHFTNNQVNYESAESRSCTDIAFYGPQILRNILPEAGAITVIFEQSFKVTVTVEHSTFIRNKGVCYGSTTAFYLSSSALSKLEFNGCLFEDNGPLYFNTSTNQNFFGSALTVFMTFTRSLDHIDCASIQNTNFWTENFSNIPFLSLSQLPSSRGRCTVVVKNITSTTDSYLIQAGSIADVRQLLIDMTDIKVNGSYPNSSRTSYSHGIIELINIRRATLEGTALDSCAFTNLVGPVISAIKTYFYLHGNITFENNHGARWVDGAAVQLYESYLVFTEPVFVLFKRNTALSGGAIYSSGAVDKLSPFCSIQYYTSALYTVHNISEMNVHISLQHNVAFLGGNSLYVDNLYNCSVQISQGIRINPNNVNAIYNAIFRKVQPVENGLQEISSIGYRVCICTHNATKNSSTLDCPVEAYLDNPIPTYLGKTLHFSLIAVDKGNNPVYSNVFFKAIELPNQDSWRLADGQEVIQMTKHACETVSVNILSKSNATNVEGKLNVYVQYSDVSLDISIVVQDCPWGFTKHPDSEVCSCSNLLRKFSLTCNVTEGTISVRKFSWIGVIGSQSNNSLVGYSVRCPLGYCRTDISCVALGEDNSSVCSQHREGILCGQCAQPYSSVIGGKECQICSNWYLLTIPVYAFVGVLLVFLLFILKLTITTGTINGVIFYANVLYLSKQRFLGDKELIWLKTFIGMINLRLGFPLCLYDGMSAIVSTHLSFIFPMYLWLISGSLVLLSRYSKRASNRLGGTALQVLATLIHLSYSTLLASTVDSLIYIDVDFEDTSGDMFSRRVWYVDGNLAYLSSWPHLCLFIVTLVIIFFFILPYTIFSTGIKIFSRFRTVNRFMPLIDAFCAPFKDKWRFWFGVRLWVLVGLYIGHAVLSGHTSSLYFMKVVVLLLFLFAQMTFMPYKSFVINLLDSFFVMNTLLLSAVTLYAQEDLQQLRYGTSALVGIAFFVFLCILTYHIYKAIKASHVCTCNWFKSLSVRRNTRYSTLSDTPENQASEMEDSAKPVTFQVLSYHPEKLRESIIVSKGSINDSQ